MALSRAIAVDGEQVQNTERVVSSALAITVRLFLPTILDGSAGTVPTDWTTSVTALGTGGILVMDSYGHAVWRLSAGDAVELRAESSGLWTGIPINKDVRSAVGEEVANGAQAVALGSVGPAAIVTPATPSTWLKVVLSDGSIGYQPVWK